MRARSFPNNLVLKIILAKDSIQHCFDVMAGVPVAVIIKAAGRFEDARQLFAARAHVVNVSRGGFVAVVKPPLLARLRPEDFVVAVGIERRVDINQVDAAIRQFLQLLQIVATVDYPRIYQR